MIQNFKSELIDLFKFFMEPKRQTLVVTKVDKCRNQLVEVEGAKRIDIQALLRSKNLKDVMKYVTFGLNQRRVMDTINNDIQSRSQLIFTIHYTFVNEETSYPCKITLCDLAGQERLSRVCESRKLYLEALFINESLSCLMRVIRDTSLGLRDKTNFKTNPLTHIIFDTLGVRKLLIPGADTPSDTIVFCCMNPSVFDEQDTLKMMELTVATQKVTMFNF